MKSLNQDIELDITATAFGGSGIARRDGRVYFVAGAVPGDRVVVAELTRRKNYSIATITKWLRLSEYRTESLCSFSKACGGCEWIDIDYDAEVEWKKQFIRDSLERIGKLSSIPELKFYPAKEMTGYRNRVQLHISFSDNHQPVVGYRMRGSHVTIPISHCPVAFDGLNEIIANINRIQFPIGSQTIRAEIQVLPAAPSRKGATPSILITLDDEALKGRALSRIVEEMKAWPNVAWSGTRLNAAQAPLFLFEQDLGLDFFTMPGLFQQINRNQNQRLRSLLLEKTEQLGINSILDLFCGSGNFSMALASTVQEITGVEMSPLAIGCAVYSAERNNLKNVTFHASEVDRFLKDNSGKYDLIIADPPRAGMLKCIPGMIKLNPSFIFYISCDPNTMARDIGLITQQGFSLIELSGFDFFPKTSHVESFAVLKRD